MDTIDPLKREIIKSLVKLKEQNKLTSQSASNTITKLISANTNLKCMDYTNPYDKHTSSLVFDIINKKCYCIELQPLYYNNITEDNLDVIELPYNEFIMEYRKQFMWDF